MSRSRSEVWCLLEEQVTDVDDTGAWPSLAQMIIIAREQQQQAETGIWSVPKQVMVSVKEDVYLFSGLLICLPSIASSRKVSSSSMYVKVMFTSGWRDRGC